jgi:hypothetical protein
MCRIGLCLDELAVRAMVIHEVGGVGVTVQKAFPARQGEKNQRH